MNFHLAKKYLNYQLFSWHKYGHGIHSPFVYSLIRDVFQNKAQFSEYQKVSLVRKTYLKSDDVIEIVDFGAGSTIFKDNKRKAFNGKCLVVLQNNGKTGAARLKAISEGLKEAVVDIVSE